MNATQTHPAALRTTNTMAILALAFGVLGWSLLPFIGGIVAIIAGHMARAEIRRNPGSQDGNGMAVIGLVLGWTSVLVGIALVSLLLLLLFGTAGLMFWAN